MLECEWRGRNKDVRVEILVSRPNTHINSGVFFHFVFLKKTLIKEKASKKQKAKSKKNKKNNQTKNKRKQESEIRNFRGSKILTKKQR